MSFSVGSVVRWRLLVSRFHCNFTIPFVLRCYTLQTDINYYLKGIRDRKNSMSSELQQQSMKFLQTAVREALENYELRPPQQEMMAACAKIIESGGTLIAEAGTGTGKTFAYLVPAILSGKKTIIATKTINLQEQLVSKDLHFLASIRDFDTP